MSALSFYTRPTYWCAHCGCPTEQEVGTDNAGSTRSIWCNNNHCPQSHQRARVNDEVYTFLKGRMATSDLDDVTLPLGLDPDNDGRC